MEDMWSAIRNRYTDSEYQQLKDDFNNRDPIAGEDPIDLFMQWDTEDTGATGRTFRTFRISEFLLYPLEDMPLYINYNYTEISYLGGTTNFVWVVRCIAKWRLRIGR